MNKNRELFYLFTTQNPTIHKFGMTTQTFDKRKSGYGGLNTPSKIIDTYPVECGFLEEHYFKEFLISKKIPILYGNEYFKFEGGIEILLLDFKSNFDRLKCRNPDERVKQINVDKQINRSVKERKLTLEGSVIHKCITCGYETKIKGNLKNHYKTNKHVRRSDVIRKCFAKWKR